MAENIQVAPGSTQQFIDIEEIKDGVVKVKGGGLRAVIMVAGINFELKSEEEQDIITNSYQEFLNSLDFPIQIVVHSRKLSIDKYLESIQKRKEEETSQLLKDQIDEYIEFVRSFVKENEIMTKNFFVVVPYQASGAASIKKGLFSIFGGKKNDKKGKDESFEQQLVQLRQRVDQVLEGLERMGLRAVVLNDEELTELYYNFYNPETVEKKLAKGEESKG